MCWPLLKSQKNCKEWQNSLLITIAYSIFTPQTHTSVATRYPFPASVAASAAAALDADPEDSEGGLLILPAGIARAHVPHFIDFLRAVEGQPVHSRPPT